MIPVIDILNGIAVHGVAGNREQYRPLESPYCETSNPVAVVSGLQKHFGFTEFYIADLDAIQHQKPNAQLYWELVDQGVDLLLDAGISEKKQLSELRGEFEKRSQHRLKVSRLSIIIGLETLKSWKSLDELVGVEDERFLIFSLDLKHGIPIENSLDEKLRDPMRIVERVCKTGIRRMIVLDLAQVGMGEGVTTLELCAKIKLQYPQCELITGGGIKTQEDIVPLKDVGIDAVLVATALHNGKLFPKKTGMTLD